MTAELDTLGFDGLPFDPSADLEQVQQQWAPAQDGRSPGGGRAEPAPGPAVDALGSRRVEGLEPPPAPVGSAPGPRPVPAGADAIAAGLVTGLRAELIAAHRSAMAVQLSWQERALAALAGGAGAGADRPVTPPAAAARDTAGRAAQPAVAALPTRYRQEGALEPLAVTPVDRLSAAELDLLAAGGSGAVFGPRYDQQAPRFATGWLLAVSLLGTGGPGGVGVLRGPCVVPADDEGVVATARQAGSVLALWLGLSLCVPRPELDVGGDCRVELFDLGGGAEAELVAEITAADLVPRPWLCLDAEIRAGERVLARVSGMTVTVREAPGTPMGTRRGGGPPQLPVRRGITGELAVVDELAMATASVGDLSLALGPEFSRYADRRATRPPAGGLRLVGRVMAVHGTRGDLSGGAVGETEYDSAADAWYYGAAPSPTVANVVLMETSLQSALLLGYHLGATLVDPDQDYSLRNLDGSATLHREVDLRGRTIRQRSTLLSTTVLTGAVLQGFDYQLWLDGEDRDRVGPFYSGQSLFGYFTAAALANQAGLDNGAFVPDWLAGQPQARTRMVEVATGASGPLHLLDRMELVDGGGRHGAGYLRAARPVRDGDWFFARHFHLDPVMPGSLGIEAVVQALQQWLLESGATAGLAEPEFVVPAGVELTWRYRGQILAGDGVMTLEAHIREVQRRPGRVRVIADASLWKPGLRIYELSGIAAEAREKGAPRW